jgi:hypothetical protein
LTPADLDTIRRMFAAELARAVKEAVDPLASKVRELPEDMQAAINLCVEEAGSPPVIQPSFATMVATTSA